MSTNNKEEKKVLPVFHLKPVSNTRVQNILSGYTKEENRIQDDELEIDNSNLSLNLKETLGKYTTLVAQAGQYYIINKFLSCNIAPSFLVNNDSIPIYYISYIYTKQFVTGCIMNTFLYFKKNESEKLRLNDPKKYYDVTNKSKSYIDGTFKIVNVPVDEKFLETIKNVIQIDVLTKYNDKLSKYEVNSEDSEYVELMNIVTQEINNEYNEIKEFFEKEHEIDFFPSKRKIYNKLKNVCDNDTFSKIVSYVLLIRDMERRKGHEDMASEKPSNVIKMTDNIENMVKTGNSDDEEC